MDTSLIVLQNSWSAKARWEWDLSANAVGSGISDHTLVAAPSQMCLAVVIAIYLCQTPIADLLRLACFSIFDFDQCLSVTQCLVRCYCKQA